MDALRQRRAGGEIEIEEELGEPEIVIPLEEQIAQFWEFAAPLQGFSVSIRPPGVEMPLLKRLGEAGFVSIPGLETLLRGAYQSISQKAIEAAYQDDDVKA